VATRSATERPGITDGGSFTMVVTGSATSPQLYLLDNNFSGCAGHQPGGSSIREPRPGPNPIRTSSMYSQAGSRIGTLIASNVFVGTPTAYRTVTSGANAIMS
jgi:hypothetical protein